MRKVPTGIMDITVPRMVTGKPDESWNVTVIISGMTPKNIADFLDEFYHPALNINWNLWQVGEPFWLSDGANFLTCEEVNEEEHTIRFRF